MIDDPKPIPWVPGEDLTAAQMNTIRDELVKCVDGYEGGNWEPTSAINVDGEGINCSKLRGSVAADDTLYVADDGYLTVQDGGHLYLDSGKQIVGSGATLEVHSGGTLIYKGSENFPQIDTQQVVRNGALVPLEENGTWNRVGGLYVANSTGGYIYFDITNHIPYGATLTAVLVRLSGNSGHSPFPISGWSPPEVEVFQLLDGAETSKGSATDNSGTAAAYEVQHDLTVDVTDTVVARNGYERWLVKVTNETGTGALGSLVITDILIYAQLSEIAPTG